MEQVGKDGTGCRCWNKGDFHLIGGLTSKYNHPMKFTIEVYYCQTGEVGTRRVRWNRVAEVGTKMILILFEDVHQNKAIS